MKYIDQLNLYKGSLAYKNYQSFCSKIIEFIDKSEINNDDTPSEYWKEELEGFKYMLDASPFIVNKLREHCYHITGVHSYPYREHHSHSSKSFENKLNQLKKVDSNNLLIGESTEMGGFGHNINGELINIDTLKFYESLIALDKFGIFKKQQNNTSKFIALEIGGGWGGFGYQFKKTIPKSTYIIVDLPGTLLFSSVYLSTIFPDSKVYFYDKKTLQNLKNNIEEYDFVFLPHFVIDEIILDKINLGINMVSFQEMTENQVLTYLKWLKNSNCESIYSHNKAKSPHNNQISDVHELIANFFDIKEYKVLDVPYTVLNQPNNIQQIKKPLKEIYKYAKTLYLNEKDVSNEIHTNSNLYRHMIGELKK